jgi:hypothetical protein
MSSKRSYRLAIVCASIIGCASGVHSIRYDDGFAWTAPAATDDLGVGTIQVPPAGVIGDFERLAHQALGRPPNDQCLFVSERAGAANSWGNFTVVSRDVRIEARAYCGTYAAEWIGLLKIRRTPLCIPQKGDAAVVFTAAGFDNAEGVLTRIAQLVQDGTEVYFAVNYFWNPAAAERFLTPDAIRIAPSFFVCTAYPPGTGPPSPWAPPTPLPAPPVSN